MTENVWALATQGMAEALVQVLKEGGDPESKASGGETPLIAASGAGHLECVRVLLQYKAKVSAKTSSGASALAKAAAQGHLDVVKALVGAKAKVDAVDRLGFTALHQATPYPEVVSFLLESKANPNAALKSGKTVLAFSRDMPEKSALLLLQAGAKLDATDSDGKTPLHFAASNGNEPVVRLLVQHGANVDALDSGGQSPLVYGLRELIQSQKLNLVLFLVERTRLLEAKGYREQTPLSTASEMGALLIVAALLEKGAEVNTIDSAGWSPLMWACTYDHLPVVQLLLQHGANKSARNSKGQTASALCNSAEIARLVE